MNDKPEDVTQEERPAKPRAVFYRFGEPRPRKQPPKRNVWFPATMKMNGILYELHRDGSAYTREGGSLRKVTDQPILNRLQEAHDAQYPR